MAGGRLVVGLGELLWDLLPDGRQLGGAPTNFAYHAAALGDRAVIASRLGTDEGGEAIRRRLDGLGLDSSYIQVDSERPTGTVQVTLDTGGQPSYVITEGVAWDAMAWTPEWEALAARADAVCCGSLAQRSPESRATIQRFLAATRANCLVIFDVNLRQHYYSAEVLAQSLTRATVAKLNHEELPVLSRLLSGKQSARSEVEQAQQLRRRFELDLVCVTRGADGCLLVGDETVEHPGYRVTVRDTVGAGDAFTAALTYHYLRGTPLSALADAANRMGAWVASCPGGTPSPDPTVLAAVRDAT